MGKMKKFIALSLVVAILSVGVIAISPREIASQISRILSGAVAQSPCIGLNDGSAAVPCLFFNNDTDTGLFRPADNTIGFTAGGGQRARISNTGFTLDSGQLLLPDGSAGAPSLAFSSEPTLGIYRPGAGLLSIMGGNVGIGTTGPGYKLDVQKDGFYQIATKGTSYFQSGGIAVMNSAGSYGSILYGGTSHASISDNMFIGPYTRGKKLYLGYGNAILQVTLDTTTGNVGIGTTGPDGQLSTGLANGQQISYKSLTELTTIADAATTVTTISIPANVIVKAVSVRVTVAIPTAASFTVIGNTSTTVFNTVAVSTALNSTDKGNLNCPYNNGAAQTIRITPNLTPANNTGRVRVTVWFEDSIPATS